MNKLKGYEKYVGKYVRNQFGIAKIIEVFEANGRIYLKLDRNIVYDVNPITGEIIDHDLRNVYPITKHTHGLNERIKDLFDLIEVGDIVNGHTVTEKALKYIETAYGEYCFGRDEKQIKTVITKEIIKKMEYNVEE